MEDWTNRSNNMDDSNPLSRVHSSSNNNRSFYTSRTSNGKATARPLRPITTPTSSLNNVPTMPIPIPVIPGTIPGNTLPSAPASPPTPAPSPTPGQRAPDWSTAAPGEEHGDVDLDLDGSDETSTNSSTRGYSFGYRHMRAQFASMENSERQRLLAELLNMCDGKLLGFVAGFVGPRLKRDPFSVLPNELCLRILTFVDDATALARSASVSRRWRELVGDDMAWKSIREVEEVEGITIPTATTPTTTTSQATPKPPTPSSRASPPAPQTSRAGPASQQPPPSPPASPPPPEPIEQDNQPSPTAPTSNSATKSKPPGAPAATSPPAKSPQTKA
ncbi:hypothetical protein LTR17_001753 [Elasticomyces elasticus]|nr:hypothetical protein LTR17_001753 [Elasticomyces elasticus]